MILINLLPHREMARKRARQVFNVSLGAAALLGLLIGGVMAAPLGAFMAKRFSPKLMLVLVGTVLTATSAFGFYKVVF